MSKHREKAQALKLRADGASISSIANRLHVSKSTVSYWCKDIKLTDQQIQEIAKNSQHRATAALLQASEHQRQQRQETVLSMRNLGARMVRDLSSRDVLMIGLGLYWGEGYKKGSQELGFTNSDPRMVTFYLRWLKSSFNINRDQLIFRVSINQAHRHREKEVLVFWQQIVNTPLSQFTKTSFIKAPFKKDVYDTKHYGTLRIKVRKGTNLRHQILGAIAELN